MLGAPLAEENARPFERLLAAYGDDPVPRGEDRVRFDDRDRLSFPDAAQREPRLAEVAEGFLDRLSGERRIRHAERFAEDDSRARFLEALRLLLREIDPEELDEDEEPENDAEHAEGVREPVGDDGAPEVELHRFGRQGALHVLDRFDRRGEGGRVGEGSAKESGDARRRKSHDALENHGERGSRAEDGDGEEVEPEAPLAERGEEPGAGLESDGVHEKNESYHIYIVGKNEAFVDGAEGHSDEENGRHAELEAEDADVSREEAEPDHRKEEEDRISGEDVQNALEPRAQRREYERMLRHFRSLSRRRRCPRPRSAPPPARVPRENACAARRRCPRVPSPSRSPRAWRRPPRPCGPRTRTRCPSR